MLIDHSYANPGSVQRASSTDTDKRVVYSDVSGADDKSILPDSMKKLLMDIAHNENSAEHMAGMYGEGTISPWISPSAFPQPSANPAAWDAFLKHQDSLQPMVAEVNEQRSAFYQDQVSKGIAPAQRYSNMLAYEANLSPDFWESMSIGAWNEGGQQLQRNPETFQAMHDFLQKEIDKVSPPLEQIGTVDPYFIAPFLNTNSHANETAALRP